MPKEAESFESRKALPEMFVLSLVTFLSIC